MKQTAVEWLTEKMQLSLGDEFKYVFGFFEQAKEMEEQQIIDAYRSGKINQLENSELYYNETFKQQEQ